MTGAQELTEAEALRRRKIGFLLIALTAMSYSTTEVSIKSLSGAFGVMQLTVLRVLAGGLLLLPFAIRHLRRAGITVGRRDFGKFAALGFVSVALHMTFLQLSLNAMDASAVAAIYSGNPIFAAVFAHFLLKEPLRRRNVCALLLEITGILLILNPFHMQISPAGFVDILLATVAFALYGTFSQVSVRTYGSIPIACFVLLSGGLELLAATLLGRIPSVAAVYTSLHLDIFVNVSFFTGFTLKNTLIFLYVCTVVTGGGYLLLTKAVEYTSATEASFVYLFKPLVATAFSVCLLGETVPANQVAGLGFFTAASLTAIVPVLLEMRRAGNRLAPGR